MLESEKGSPSAKCAGEYENDQTVVVPIPYAAGPSMFAIDLFSHETTVDVIEKTRQFCDYDSEARCWLTGMLFSIGMQVVSSM